MCKIPFDVNPSTSIHQRKKKKKNKKNTWQKFGECVTCSRWIIDVNEANDRVRPDSQEWCLHIGRRDIAHDPQRLWSHGEHFLNLDFFNLPAPCLSHYHYLKLAYIFKAQKCNGYCGRLKFKKQNRSFHLLLKSVGSQPQTASLMTADPEVLSLILNRFIYFRVGETDRQAGRQNLLGYC